MTITKTQIIAWLLLTVVAIIGIILLVRVLKGSGNTDNTNYLELVKAKDETIKAKDEVIASKNEQNVAQDVVIADGKKLRDEYLKLVSDLQPKYKANDIKYQNIPIAIRNLSTKDSLRRAIIEP